MGTGQGNDNPKNLKIEFDRRDILWIETTTDISFHTSS